jgi:cell division protein FtsA
MQSSSLTVQQVVQDVLASAFGVLCEDEMDLGCALIDIGGGTTKMTVFQKKAPVFSTSLPMAGDQITSDIALALHTPKQSAETIKLRHGTCDVNKFNEKNVIQIPTIGEKNQQQTTYQELHDIITPRVEEIFQMTHDKLQEKQLLDKIRAGIVITGGSARLDNIVKSAQKIFNCPIRIGYPKLSQQVNEILDSPASACVFGLSEWAYQQQKYIENMDNQARNNWWGALKKWIVN